MALSEPLRASTKYDMRYRDLLETSAAPPHPQRPLILPKAFAADVKLVVRFMPAVYRWLDLMLFHGRSAADIRINRASVHFPEPYDAEGALTSECRQWIIASVQDVVERLGLSICIIFSADEAIFVWPGGKLATSGQPPEGGLPI